MHRTQTRTPAVRLPPTLACKNKRKQTGDETDTDIAPVPVASPRTSLDDNSISGGSSKGRFKTESYSLKKKNIRSRKYHCRMCTATLDNAQELGVHHCKVHGIVYCDDCGKAFNNQLSLICHKYDLTVPNKHVCDVWGESFPFESRLTKHKLVHKCHASHFCSYPGCVHKFKSKGDLNRHAKQHTRKAYQCLDYSYSHKDKCNYDSHRLKHSKITKFKCENCGQEFTYSTQKIRHKCTTHSKSLEF